MPTVFGLDTGEVRTESQRVVSALGGALCDWLPWLEDTQPRSRESVIRRALVMNAMIQIALGAPTAVIRDWIERHALRPDLSENEAAILQKNDVTEQEKTDLFWTVEALWAFAWIGSFIDDIPIEQQAGNALAGFLPNLKVNEPPDRFANAFRLRRAAEIYRQFDRYYLAHWYARDGQLRGRDTNPFSLDVIMERRKALAWTLDASIAEWDETPADT